MKDSEKRHFCGCFMPNIFFLLQVAIVLLFLLVAMQTVTIFDVDPFFGYVYVCVAIVAVMYCVKVRRNVIDRQFQHCDEYAKQKKNEKRFK